VVPLFCIITKFRVNSNNNILKKYFREIETKNRGELDREMYFRRNGMSGIEVKKKLIL